MASKTKRQLLDLGWSEAGAGWRAAAIDASHAHGRSLAAGVPDGHCVAVEYSSGASGPCRTVEGFVTGGRLQVGGVAPSAGMVGRRLSRPYRVTRHDFSRTGDPAAVLADGTEVLMGPREGGAYSYTAAGRTYPTILAAAVELTPA